MPEEPYKETPADQARPVYSAAGISVPGGTGDEDDTFPYSLQIGDIYDGPLDVLLAMIKKQNLDIYDLPMAAVTSQFLAYSRTIPAEEVERAIEFVHMASQLIFIKSRMLLPIERPFDGNIPEDPRKSLVERLLEHEQMKQAAMMLRDRHWAEEARWVNPGAQEFKDDVDVPEPSPATPSDAGDLKTVYQQILDRAAKRAPYKVGTETYTVAEMFVSFRETLRSEDEPISFEEAIGGSPSPRIITAAFLAILEMVRLGAVLLRQDSQFGSILIKKSSNFEEAMNLAAALDQWT